MSWYASKSKKKIDIILFRYMVARMEGYDILADCTKC